MLRRNVLEKLRRRKAASKRMSHILLTLEELDRDVATVLTTSNPYFVESAVEFSYKDREFKPLQNRNRAIVFYEQKGSIKRKAPPVDSKDSNKHVESVEELDTKRKNKFNYCDRATQTLNFLHVDKETQTEPLPQIVFDGTVSPADIFQAYLEKEDRRQRNIEDTANKTIRKSSRKGQQTQNPESQRRFFRFCERMIDQNLLSDVNIDFSFYDTPSDEFKDKGLGSLLALWKFSHQPMKGMPVTGLSWNSFYPDMFAVAFGTYDLTKRHQQGCVCVFSLKCPSYPEKVIPCKSGVYCVEFNRERSYLLAVGFADGTVAVYDLRRNTHSPIAINKTIKLEHNDIVNQVKWLPDNIDGQHNFCSISADCRVINWLLAKSELIPSEVINLRQNDMTTETPEKSSAESMSCGTSISFNPDCSDLFLIGTENGFIHKCSNLSTAQHLDVYKDHSNIVYNVHWNPYHPRVFLSCSADWTIRVWDHTLKESVFTFDLLNEVKDVTWAPFSSSLFAAVTSDGKVHIFDIMMNRQQPTSSYTVYNSKKNTNLTSVQFNPIKPVIIIGDDKGSVISFKLSPNLRSSLKAFQTLERLKFAASERDKMEKILKLARNLQNNDQEL
ncbi:dynein intermediate chain 1, axonemal [Caerostris darwini]|uniref:Dynein intermediate chain 1, axonemal n=1 Tax=Caerostris darwini TaxID=1538125 RepID=A0AAV4TCF0_9ARAC|nr:dynein intermediate chain 1, axonemal [Caerostris darwini]